MVKELMQMRKILKTKIIAIGLALTFFLGGCHHQDLKNEGFSIEENKKTKKQQMEEAKTTPFGRYPEMIIYTLGKMSNSNNAGMPKEDDFENNAYTRYLKKILNIQNKNVFDGSGSNYNEMVVTAITSGEIPDIMVVEDYEYLKILVEKDMIEDLTPYYEQCASERVKDIYHSYGEHFFDEVTFDGNMMALPETLIDSGPNILWLRYDWLEQLGLKEPKTMKDVEEIAKAFQEKDMSKTGETIGLPMTTGISSDYIASMNILFACHGAYLQNWILKDGTYQYGSILPEAKEGLRELRRLYAEGTLDQEFLFRGDQNIEELIQEGKCGIFFGEWWSGDNPLMKAKELNKKADWRPYLIATDSDGKTSYVQQNPVGKYVVVRKGFEHPEILIKMHNVLFAGLENGKKEFDEIAMYYQKNVDPTARPCSINIDYNDALNRAYNNIYGALSGMVDPSELELMDYSYYQASKRYLKEEENADPEDWAGYATRILACSLLQDDSVRKVEAKYPKLNEEWMETKWELLQKLERETYLSIIIGEKPLSYFDEFVKQWKVEGGERITKEINEW